MVERFHDVIIRADFEARDLVGIDRLYGQHDHGNGRGGIVVLKLLQNAEAIFVGKLKVKNDQLGFEGGNFFEEFSGAGSGVDNKAVSFQNGFNQPANIRIVIDN